MPRSSPALLVVLVYAVCAPSAWAQGGSGLYEPFPEPASAQRAQDYVEQLGVSVSVPQLRQGRFVGDARQQPTAAPAQASDRAQAGAAGAWLPLPLVAGTAVAVLLTLRRRA